MTAEEAPKTQPLAWGLDGTIEQPRVVHSRDVVYLAGWCFHPHGQIRHLELVVAGEPHPVSQYGLPRPDVLHDQVRHGLDPAGHSFLSGFWATVPVACPEARRRVPCSLRARLSNGRTVEASLGELDLTAAGRRERSPAPEPLIAICMATYNPPLDLLEEQMDSLLGQTYSNWICLVNDDRSAPSLFAEVERLAARDSRFDVERNPRRLGYYRNFEGCLSRVPPQASHVAFCDQDDLWYPEKLADSLAAFDPDVSLVYCDMHIVDRDGKRIADSYWTARSNNYTDLSTLIFANTVTGAASLFRAELLDLALPFPEAVGDAFHDHWVACTALASGRIAYVNRALYAYRQHGGNVIGHYTAPPARPIVSRVLGRLRSLSVLKQSLRGRLRIAQHGYRIFTRTAVFARTLQARLPGEVSGEKRAVVARLASMERSLWPVVGEAVQARLRGRPTLGMEWLCVQGAVGTRLSGAYYRFKQGRIRAQALINVRTSPPPAPQPAGAETYDGAEFLVHKTAPVKLSVSRRAPRRVNVVVSTVDFRYLFAGYFSMFNLALHLAGEGQRTRLVIVDECEYDPPAWRAQMADYPGLEGLFDAVETSYHRDRSVPLEVSPDDSFVATSWWTAHIAHRASRELGHPRFTFFIQEFEPLFYPAGSLFAMALESYGYPHYAIFSTEMLRDHFRQERLGVFRETARGESDSVAISNAVPAFVVEPSAMRDRTRHGLVFYARPEAHAARNMFEVGLLALRKAVAAGYLDPRVWDFYGIGGSDSDTVDLGWGAVLRLLPRTGLKEYVAMLPGYDLGLSLMLSPHPSMTPLDMAAAGLVTVTNTYTTKTRERLAAISSNIVPVEPTLEAIAAGLAQAARRVDGVEERVAASRLNWSASWDETFSPEVMSHVRRFVEGASAPGGAGGRTRADDAQGAGAVTASSALPVPPHELLAYAGLGSPEKCRSIGDEFMGHLEKIAGLRSDSHVLDIGCGPGRMALSLTRLLHAGSYEGFDVHGASISWCEEQISTRFPNFRFRHADVRNDLYNPRGAYEVGDYRFPYEDGVFDVVFLGSVFTHMLPEDMGHYLREIARVLKPGGRCLATLFLMNEESKAGVGRGESRYPIRHDLGVYHVAYPDRPEEALGYDESFALASFERVGLVVQRPIHYGSWCGRRGGLSFQDTVLAVKQ